MSALKVQLRLILPELSKEANANQDKEIRRHLYLIKAVCSSTKSVKQVCEKRGISTDQFYLWGKRLLKKQNLGEFRVKVTKAEAFAKPNEEKNREKDFSFKESRAFSWS